MKISYIFIIIGIFLFNGCSTKTSNLPEVKQSKTIKIIKKNDYSNLEKELIEIAKEHKRAYNEYIEILTSLKKRTRMYDKTKIPKRLARRTTFHYEGPALRLLQNIAEETQYSFDYNKYRIYDSKQIVRNYTDTMLIDIIYDITSQLNVDVLIDEKNDIIKLQER